MSYYTRALGVASNSALSRFRISPYDYKLWCDEIECEPTDSMREGTAFHLALNEPEKFARMYLVIPEMPLRSEVDKLSFLSACSQVTALEALDPYNVTFDVGKTKAERIRQFVVDTAKAAGISLVTDTELSTMRSMVASLNEPRHTYARGIISRGVKEMELYWADPITGIRCKAKPDSWDAELGIEADLKRTVHITEGAFRRHAVSSDYHYQRAFYRRGLRANGEDVNYSCMVCGSPVAPSYHWAVYSVPEDVMDECDARITDQLISLARCLETGKFPGLNNGEPRVLDIKREYV